MNEWLTLTDADVAAHLPNADVASWSKNKGPNSPLPQERIQAPLKKGKCYVTRH